MSILEFLGLGRIRGGEPDAKAAAETDSVRKIVDELDHMDPDRARFIAAFAFVLSRVARADLHVSDEETAEMEKVVTRHGGLPEAQAVIVVQMAKSQNLIFGGTENFLVTRELNRIATRDEKTNLLECLFAVSAADRSISAVEDNVIRQITKELQLEHRDFIRARASFKEHLAVLQKPDRHAG